MKGIELCFNVAENLTVEWKLDMKGTHICLGANMWHGKEKKGTDN